MERNGGDARLLDRAGVLPDALVPGARGGGAFAAVWVAYRFRVRQVAHAYQRRLDERLNERMRIARDLHDTLLQSFHGLLLRFQTASYLLLEHPADAKEKLDDAIQHAAKAITEGRDAVQSLRASTVEHNDLAVAIRTLGDELASDPSAHQPLTFSVAVEGETRDLHPIARDEIYKVAAEALRNAYRHAHASRVEVEIRYDRRANSDCGCATMARGSIRGCSQARKSRATTDCVACLNAPR